MRPLFSSFVLHSSLLAILVVAVCAAPPPAKKIKLDHESSSQALVAKLVTIEKNCQPNQQKVERTLEDMYTIATEAQAIKKEDVAYTHYFMPDKHAIEFDKDKLKEFPMDPMHIEDSKIVPKMFESIVTGGGKGTKFTAFCPTEAEHPTCKDTLALAVTAHHTSDPKIAFCESFFHDKDTKNDLSTKDKHQWCTGPPHLDNLLTGAHTVLHEVTHLAFIVLHAVEAVVGELPKEAREKLQGTEDIYEFADEKNGNVKTYANEDNIPGASRTLKERWINYFANRVKVLSARPPPIAPIDNAESYAGAGTEYYFTKLCPNFKNISV